MNNIVYSHRPSVGVSVGALSQNGKLYIAAAFTNDGTSRSGYFYPERMDRFSRRKAHAIIEGRITAMLGGKFPQYGFYLVTDQTASKFMREFRERFKPDPYELDDTFHIQFPKNESIVVDSARMSIQGIWEQIQDMAHACVSV